MIIQVNVKGSVIKTQDFMTTAIKEGLVVYTKTPEGTIQPVVAANQETPLLVELDSPVELLSLTRHYDLMVIERNGSTAIYIDAKGGRFRQR